VSVDSRTVLGVAVLVASIAALSRLDGSRRTALATAPIRWMEIAKGPPHAPPL
jgi:hypothetical protein